MKKVFKVQELKKVWRPDAGNSKFMGGQVVVIGGSDLFHGAPILALKAASRLVDMVYFASPKINKGVAERIKASLGSFIWIPFEDASVYIKKSDAVLIGPGLMRYRKENGDHNGAVCDDAGKETKKLTENLLKEFPDKKWVIDGGSLQVMDPKLIPSQAILTPNVKEFGMLFGEWVNMEDLEEASLKVMRKAKEYKCVICLKGATTIVSDGRDVIWIEGGSVGLIKGGTGDILAGLTTAFLAKNEPSLSASVANFLIKRAGEELEDERGVMFNADDVADQVPKTWGRLLKQIGAQ